MNVSQIYFAVAVVALALVALLVYLTNRNTKQARLSTLAGLAFAFVLAGIFFGENRLIGYGLMGVGILLAVIDIFNKSKKK